MKISIKDVTACKTKIQGFMSEAKQPIRMIDLFVELGEGECRVIHIQTFVIVNVYSTYNVFLD